MEGLSEEKFAQMQLRAKTDLFFLGKEVMGKDFTVGTHKAMCDFYVKKDPSFERFKDFALQYTGARDRIQMVPRETYKSSIKVVDNVQWIINWPEIRIMTVTSTDDLSTAFIDELIGYFTVRGKAERGEDGWLIPGKGRPTNFQKLFWEHCVTETEGRTGEFITPLRNILPANLIFKDPTAGTLSMNGSTSGWHCDVLDFDDPVSDRNSETGSQLEKLKNRMAMIFELLMNHGFRHTVATRYDPQDPYVDMLESHGIRELYGDFESEGLKAMLRPCWWLKGKPFAQPDYKTWVPVEAEIDLFFPEGVPFHALKKKMKNAKTFSSQQLNNPSNVVNVAFTEQDIRDAIVDHTALPKVGTIFASWDFAYGQADSTEDYSTGVIGLLDNQRRWWITDIYHDHWNFSEKCFQVVKAIQTHKPKRTCIEDTPGVKGAMDEPIARYGKELKVPTDTIDWISTGQGVSDAKYLRICATHPWILQKRLFFLNRISCMDAVIEEYKNVKSKSKKRNDLPDAIARLVQEYSRYAVEIKAPTQAECSRQFLEMAHDDFYNLMHRKGKYSEGGTWELGQWNGDYVPPAAKPEGLDPESPSYAIDSMFEPV